MRDTSQVPTLKLAEQLDLDAAVEHKKQNHVYANELARRAHHLRMEHQLEAKRDKLKKD